VLGSVEGDGRVDGVVVAWALVGAAMLALRVTDGRGLAVVGTDVGSGGGEACVVVASAGASVPVGRVVAASVVGTSVVDREGASVVVGRVGGASLAGAALVGPPVTEGVGAPEDAGSCVGRGTDDGSVPVPPPELHAPARLATATANARNRTLEMTHLRSSLRTAGDSG
jgi:hypothetical protein